MAARLLDMGAAAALLKLGDQGLYLRTTADARRLAEAGVIAGGGCHGCAAPVRRRAPVHGCFAAVAPAWAGREVLSPCFAVRVAGTTGSGDCTIAGFLAALVKGLSPEGAVTAATAVGACCCEAADSTSGVPRWSAVQGRIRRGWRRREVRIALPGWRHDKATGLWFGPWDGDR
jgi:hypothetical protein